MELETAESYLCEEKIKQRVYKKARPHEIPFALSTWLLHFKTGYLDMVLEGLSLQSWQRHCISQDLIAWLAHFFSLYYMPHSQWNPPCLPFWKLQLSWLHAHSLLFFTVTFSFPVYSISMFLLSPLLSSIYRDFWVLLLMCLWLEQW